MPSFFAENILGLMFNFQKSFHIPGNSAGDLFWMVINMTLSKGVGDLQLNTKEKVTLNRLWIYPHPPSNSNLQDYYSFSRESQPEPLFATSILGGGWIKNHLVFTFIFWNSFVGCFYG